MPASNHLVMSVACLSVQGLRGFDRGIAHGFTSNHRVAKARPHCVENPS